DVAAQLRHDVLIVPGAGADEVLHGLARAVGEGGDGLGRLALEVTELALEDDPGEFVVLLAVEAGQVAPQEVLQAATAAAHVLGGDLSSGEQSQGGRVFEQGHPCHSPSGLPDQGVGRLVYPPMKNGYSRTRKTVCRVGRYMEDCIQG